MDPGPDLMTEDQLLKPEKTRIATHTTQLLLSVNRNRQTDIYESREEAIYKIFNHSVFKLAVILERVRLYRENIV